MGKLILDELPHLQGQGRWPRGATTQPKSREVTERSNPMLKEQRLRRRKRAERSYSTFKVRRDSCEIPLVQGKEQRLHFAGVAVKKYPTSRVKETQVRW